MKNLVPEQASKKSSYLQWWKVCGAILLAGILTILVFIALVSRASSGAVEASNEFFELLSVGEYVAAYYGTSYNFQLATGIEAFYDYIDRYPSITEVVDISYSTREIESTNLGSFTNLGGELITAGGDYVPILLVYIQEDSEWKLFGFELYPNSYE